ncbi:MAG: glycosyltransferase [Candidatus Kerfeldbacteria bacterium]|nr:glycosyltransferase [Candidatus Kerfeldbacteria bacterium]
MKVALVHDHLAQDGGAEKVVRALAEVFPESPLYVVVYDTKRANPFFLGKDIRTSFIQHLPFGVKRYQWFLPLMPRAVESFDLSEYDVIISSSSSLAKGVKTRADQLHICYCHTPTRFLWTEMESYVAELQIPRWIKFILPAYLRHLRRWDRKAADRVNVFLANSTVVKDRIKTYYKREAVVIYPPLATLQFTPASDVGEYFLAGGRLVPYKRYDLVVQTFNRLGLPLKIFGDGPMLRALERQAEPNVTFVGRVADAELAELYAHAQAFLNPQEEDLGITPLESMASGRPVIAYRKGGALESMVEGETGIFFDEQSADSLTDAIRRFQSMTFDPARIRNHAEQFDVAVFKKKMKQFIEEQWNDFHHSRSFIPTRRDSG